VDTIGSCFPPGLEFLVAFLACAAAGVVAVPARPPDPLASRARFHEARTALLGIANLSGAQICLTTKTYAAAFALAETNARVTSFFRGGKKEKCAPFTWVSMERLVGSYGTRKGLVGSNETNYALKLPHHSKENKSSVAFVQCTSGSTGAPKVRALPFLSLDSSGPFNAPFTVSVTFQSTFLAFNTSFNIQHNTFQSAID
jgi:acyl-CoA synthetase (AMP-forming)/AMP-acid ligase II